MSESLLIYGSKSYAKTLTQLASAVGFDVKGYLDDTGSADPGVIGGFDVLASRPGSSLGLGVGYGNLPLRAALIERLRTLELKFPALVHPAASVDATVRVGKGAVVMRGTLADINSEVGDFSVLWPGVVLNHDSRVGANSFLSPGVIVCGNVRIGANCFIGAGSVIVDGREVPDGSFVKAGTIFK